MNEENLDEEIRACLERLKNEKVKPEIVEHIIKLRKKIIEIENEKAGYKNYNRN